MSSLFVRKNLLTVIATFTAADGSSTQPTTVIAVVDYRARINNARTTTTIALTFNATYATTDSGGNAVTLTNVWVGTWDSSPATDGVVEWLVYGDGALTAASQGRFQLLANLANQATA